MSWRVFGAGLLLAASPVYAQTPASSAAQEKPTLVSVLDGDALRDLPSSDSLFSIIETTQPSLISDRFSGGGLYAGQGARIGGFLSSWTQTMFRIGDVNITDPASGGTPLLLPSLFLWQQVDIATGLMPIDVQAPGVAVSLEPRRPTGRWVRTVQGSASHLGLTARAPSTAAPAIARLDGWDHGSVLASGPVLPGRLGPNRLGAVLAASWTRGSQFHRGEPLPVEATVGSAFTHVVFAPNDLDEVRTIGWLQRASHPFDHREAFSRLTAATKDSSTHLQSTWERRAPDGRPWRVFGSFTERTRTPDLLDSASAVFERLSDGPVSEISYAAAGTVRRWSIGGRLLPPARDVSGRAHALQAGVEVGGSRAKASPAFSGAIGELVDGMPARVWSFATPRIDSLRREMTVAAYVGDHVELAPRVVLDAGIRFDSASGSADAPNDVRWRTWLPRADVRWEIADTWRIAAFAGYARSAYQLTLDLLAIGDPAAPTADVYRWDVPAGGAAPSLTALGPRVARVGPGTGGDVGFSRIDPELRQPHADEFVIGLESRPRDDLRLRLVGVARRESQLLAVVNTGAPASAYSVVGVQDPGLLLEDAYDDQVLPVYNRLPASFGRDQYVLTNPVEDAATFKGIEVSAQLRRERVVLLAGATASMAEGSAGSRGFGPLENDQSRVGELFANLNAATFARGRLFNDRAYTIKLIGIYRFPRDVRLGMIARYQDGQPFARLVVVPDLNQGAEAIRAFPNGGSRFTFTGTLDVRLQKGFAIGGRRLDAVLDAYNLLNLSYEVEERVATGTGFRTVTAVQPSRAFHVGARLTF